MKLVLTLLIVFFGIQTSFSQIPPPPPPQVREAPQEESDDVVAFPTVEPEFKGGTAKMSEFIGKHIEYPEECIDKGITGKVYVSFVVDKKGRIKNVQVDRSVHPKLDEAAVNVINKMPKWRPGEQDGKRVKCRVRIPIIFSLN